MSGSVSTNGLTAPASGPSSSTSANGQGSASNGAAPGPSSSSGLPSMSSIPPHVLQALQGLNKQKLQNMVQRIQQLKQTGETEHTSQELANLLTILKYFQQFQMLKQQEALVQQRQQASNQATSSAAPTPSQASDVAPPSTSAVGTSTTAPAPAPATTSTEPGSAPVTIAPTSSAVAVSQTSVASSVPSAQTSSPANGSSTPVSKPTVTAAPVTAPHGASQSTSVFSKEQLDTLRAQIVAFKLISRNVPLPAHLHSALLDPNQAIDDIRGGLPDLTAAGDAGKVAEAGIALHLAATNGSEEEKSKATTADETGEAGASQSAEVSRPTLPSDDPSSAVYPYNAYRLPFTYLQRPTTGSEDLTATKQQRLLVPSLMPAGLDPFVLATERDRMIAARINQRIRELENLPSTMSQRPTIRGAEEAAIKEEASEVSGSRDGTMSGSFEDNPLLQSGYQADNAKIKALIELKSLRLLEKQKELRQSVVRTFSSASTLALDRTAFRKVKKQTLRDARMTEQLERKQRVDRERRNRQKHTDYLATIVNHGRDLQAAHRAVQTNAQRIGKLVLRFHSETEKEEAKRLKRIAEERLQALKADDEEAYLKLIDTAKDTRITHLIRQTDSYLNSLAEAVQAQQNDDVHAEAIAAERQKVDYYSIAHRITERVLEQPTILVGGKLKEYQIKGLQWMVSLYNNRLNGILADEMGLGKTIQTISLITFLIEHKRQPGPYLVIVPLSTLTNWVNEFEKWAPSVATLVFKGPPLARRHLSNRIRQGHFQVLLTTYEYVIKEKALLGKIRWVHMIIDEGHRMKNTESKLTVTLVQNYVSRYRLLLTGTPLQNNLPELWALLNFVLPRIFNSVKSFDEWFNTPFANTGSGDSAMQLNEEEALLIIKRLHKVLRPFLLRRLKKDVESELPDKVEKVIKCKMSSLQRKLYSQMKNHKMLLAGDDIGGAVGGRKQKQQGIKGLQNAIMQLRKICNHPYVFEQVELAINPTKQTGPDLYRVSGKFELLDRLLPKLKAFGHRVLIFFQMTHIMDIMEDFLRFRGHKYCRLDGTTKPDDRSLLLKAFNAPDSDIFAFILSTRAGGLGLNLQTADTVIIYDSDWNPHQDLQAQDRAHRIGQKMEVRILRFVTERSVEEVILERANHKLQIDGKVIQAGKFDNSSGNEEREDLLRAMLEADQEEEAEEDGDLGDAELNEILARGEHELERFKEMDIEREKLDAEEWKALGHTGKPPERLIQESELPTLYQQDFDTAVLEEVVEEEELSSRKRAVVHYDDGLTEEQFLRALEDDDIDLADVVEKKRVRAEKRRRKQLAKNGGGGGEDSDAGTPEPSAGKKKGRKSAVGGDTPEPSPKGGPRKRKRLPDSVSASPERDNTPIGGRGNASATAKRQRMAGGDDPRDQLRDALVKVYRALENACDDDGRQRCRMFLDVPKKADYPDYHVLIQRPVAMRQVKRRIDNRSYREAYLARNDIHQMVLNAKTYNQEGSWVWNDAVELQKAWDRAYAEHVIGTDLPGIDGPGDPLPTNGEAASALFPVAPVAGDAADSGDNAALTPNSARPRIRVNLRKTGPGDD
ncbi:snf2-family atp dependent chromatin remodeling factor snf21 [Ceraceosorus bombacis]|uniref:Snf2-family atp dependent chromatin remodeling factor snf21 n=1 Tax=Ceraceosorus bombacis TaxID=401625 RepID=A0A0P1BC77_9BASI|nr:snf2-family atp dependent chromatin remodeling factor snf21 [Ceraceosorus bombacis]